MHLHAVKQRKKTFWQTYVVYYMFFYFLFIALAIRCFEHTHTHTHNSGNAKTLNLSVFVFYFIWNGGTHVTIKCNVHAIFSLSLSRAIHFVNIYIEFSILVSVWVSAFASFLSCMKFIIGGNNCCCCLEEQRWWWWWWRRPTCVHMHLKRVCIKQP